MTDKNIGSELIEAIKGKRALLDIGDCPGVSVNISKAFYGLPQNDSPKNDPITKANVYSKIVFGGANSETAVWHFLLEGLTHHFVVVPWYKHTLPHGQVYSVFMAYEDKYTLGQYISSSLFKNSWTTSELILMFEELLTKGFSWGKYIDSSDRSNEIKVKKISYWKYKTITVNTAFTNLSRMI